jgi:hypothetical protein
VSRAIIQRIGSIKEIKKMKKLVLSGVCLFLWAAVAVEASEKKLQRQILGVRLNMTKDEAHNRLQEIGTFVRDEKPRQEIWQVRDQSFSHLIIGFGKDDANRLETF